MKKRIRINCIFWKEGPLLARLFSYKRKSAPIQWVEYDI
jgi:hypothetical protein